MSAIIVCMETVRAGRSLVKAATDDAAIGERISAARRVRGMRGVDLAAATGIAPNTISNWESGIRKPSIENAAMLKAVLGISTDWLFFGDDTALPWQHREQLLAELEKVRAERPPGDNKRKVTG